MASGQARSQPPLQGARDLAGQGEGGGGLAGQDAGEGRMGDAGVAGQAGDRGKQVSVNMDHDRFQAVVDRTGESQGLSHRPWVGLSWVGKACGTEG